ncbi:hypothetical protein KV697_10465 [Sphingomonas sanguinis]|uniref:PPIase cyclophilin-type domain-containing protein n=1 Tax=Sphingomonas sanguinis TaxID=33051 RepID=A0ABU5LNE3_9SPHN|nr:hypothetical protein [Sphingomonas sanguinis]MDZ7281230.1 hypothetical protein [Sphingomonas sanguinis]QXT34261.1 hypothetical protein KV697_10465 [Sphingomonas sanguinis]
MRRLACLFMATLTAATSPPSERVIAPDGLVSVTINGVARSVRIDPGVPAMPIITKEFAEAASMKPGMFGFMMGFGPKVMIAGRTAVARVAFGGAKPAKQRIGFTEKPYAAGFAGVFGPGSVPDPIVRFRLRDAVAGERITAFPMVDQGDLFGGWAERFAIIMVEGQPMRVRFDPHHPRTLANAGAAVRLARAYGGTLSGATSPTEIAFGIQRPIRTMTLTAPFAVGPLTIATLGVRTVDHGSTETIADADQHADPNEVVVTGKGKHDINRDRLAIGADQLNRCSSIVFDKPARQVRLSCL